MFRDKGVVNSSMERKTTFEGDNWFPWKISLRNLFIEFPKTKEILAERILKIGPNGFLAVIVKWLARYLKFRFFFWNSTYVRRFGAKNEKTGFL